MTDAEKAEEWARFFKACERDYQLHALRAVLVNDGERMLSSVVKKLQLGMTVDLVKG